jgi:hypothetical protein
LVVFPTFWDSLIHRFSRSSQNWFEVTFKGHPWSACNPMVFYPFSSFFFLNQPSYTRMQANADGPFSWFCRAAEESLSAKLPALLRASWVSMPKAGSLGHLKCWFDGKFRCIFNQIWAFPNIFGLFIFLRVECTRVDCCC